MPTKHQDVLTPQSTHDRELSELLDASEEIRASDDTDYLPMGS